MQKNELVKILQEETSLPETEVRSVLNALIVVAKEEVERKGSFDLPGVGNFRGDPGKNGKPDGKHDEVGTMGATLVLKDGKYHLQETTPPPGILEGLEALPEGGYGGAIAEPVLKIDIDKTKFLRGK